MKVNSNKQLFFSSAEEYLTPREHEKGKRKYTFIQGAPATMEKRGENITRLPFEQSITAGDKMPKTLGNGGNERSNFILVQRHDEYGNYLSHKEIQEGKEV
jgi:hypothetical protein